MRYFSTLLLLAMTHVTYSRTRLRGSYTWLAPDGAQKSVEGIGHYPGNAKQETRRGKYYIHLDYWQEVFGKGSKRMKKVGAYDTITATVGDMARISEGLEPRSSELNQTNEGRCLFSRGHSVGVCVHVCVCVCVRVRVCVCQLISAQAPHGVARVHNVARVNIAASFHGVARDGGVARFRRKRRHPK